jgi:hypothetical protein
MLVIIEMQLPAL